MADEPVGKKVRSKAPWWIALAIAAVVLVAMWGGAYKFELMYAVVGGAVSGVVGAWATRHLK